MGWVIERVSHPAAWARINHADSLPPDSPFLAPAFHGLISCSMSLLPTAAAPSSTHALRF
jgi:hypothetical protein